MEEQRRAYDELRHEVVLSAPEGARVARGLPRRAVRGMPPLGLEHPRLVLAALLVRSAWADWNPLHRPAQTMPPQRRGGRGGEGATGAPRSATRPGEEQHRHTERGSHTRRDKGEHSRQGGGAQRGRRGNQNSGNREPEWSGWESVRMGGSDDKGDGSASQPRRYRVPGQPLLNRRNRSGSPSGADQP